MSSIDNNELFEKYYQTEYDFNTTLLALNEIDAIKILPGENINTLFSELCTQWEIIYKYIL